ncbi:MAG: family peptidase [Thermoleophilia bacterium]|nr:family peptidase [Thermoleophilia bacterium]
MCNIAPAGVAPAATPVSAGGPTGSAPLSTDGVTPVPSILQPAPTDVGGVSGGGPTGTPEIQAALEAVHGAIGTLNGALQAIQGGGAVGTPPVTGGGAGGCGCGQVTQGPAQLGANAAPDAPEAAKPDKVEKPVEAAKPDAPKPAAATGPGQAPAGFKIKDPLPGAKLTSHYGEVASIRGGRPHTGMDLAKPAGTPILSAAPGKILKVGFEGSGLGNYVYVDHGNGWVTRYGHMVEKSPLKEGDVVDAGTPIGKVGSTGNSTGPHLHFMVVKNGEVVNPEPFFKGEKTF